MSTTVPSAGAVLNAVGARAATEAATDALTQRPRVILILRSPSRADPFMSTPLPPGARPVSRDMNGMVRIRCHRSVKCVDPDSSGESQGDEIVYLETIWSPICSSVQGKC